MINVRDKEGDIADTLYIKRIRTNRSTPLVLTLRDSFPYAVPNVPDKTYRSEFDVDWTYQELLSADHAPNIPGSSPPQKEPDSLIIKFVLRDKAHHYSDTLVLPQIIVMRNS